MVQALARPKEIRVVLDSQANVDRGIFVRALARRTVCVVPSEAGMFARLELVLS
jgi:hypothetical protein